MEKGCFCKQLTLRKARQIIYFCPMEVQLNESLSTEQLSFEHFREAVLNDYRICCISREASLLGRKEVLTGKAKFGIFGDGKELVQVALAKFYQPGDFRSGYYRDQTWMLASGITTVQQFFSQLFADPDVSNDPFSAGRQMNAHFATPNVDADGNWLPLARKKNVAADLAPTAGQMPRAVGLALASKLFRSVEALKPYDQLSDHGNEICFCSIGDASTSEGHFWESVNAAAVQQIPMAIFVWDDGYGISVPKKYQTAKGSISEALSGFRKKDGTNGIDIYKVKAWDYAGMCEVFEQALAKMRTTHTPALFHVEEVTQPQGHSTSGSHERYKTPERLAWEQEWDCIKKFREWILSNDLSSEAVLQELEEAAREQVRAEKNKAWEAYQAPIKAQAQQAIDALQALIDAGYDGGGSVQSIITSLQQSRDLMRRDILKALGTLVQQLKGSPLAESITQLYHTWKKEGHDLYERYLYTQTDKSAVQVSQVPAAYDENAPVMNGYEILNQYFDQLFTRDARVVAFGEDVGFIGDVNQGFAGLQAKHGENRIFDTGIRELTIVGQAVGLALRGIRPIAEIQYLDYLLYGLQPLSDDVATLHWRTAGQQSCPLIIRTRGHRLEGVWHSGSPMGMIINSLRGMHVCVPRNMVQAAGMYNTLLQSNDPALVIECLNGYRLKEKPPSNLDAFTVPLGMPEILRAGEDITIVSYGSTLRIVMEAAETLAQMGVSCEVVDVQTLLPFDLQHRILESLKKTSRILFVDEDVPGGAAAYMFNHVMEQQGGYRWLDVAPRTLTAKAHRPAFGSDGDYFSKPNTEDVVETVQSMMHE